MIHLAEYIAELQHIYESSSNMFCIFSKETYFSQKKWGFKTKTFQPKALSYSL